MDAARNDPILSDSYIWSGEGMATLVFGMMQSLDGYVDDIAGRLALPPPGVALGRHFIDHVRGLAGSLYGRRIYEIMRYWDEDQPDWDAGDHEFAAAWRSQPKWIVSRTLKSVGPNATLVAENVDTFARRLKEDVDGEIDVAGQGASPISVLSTNIVFTFARSCWAAESRTLPAPGHHSALWP